MYHIASKSLIYLVLPALLLSCTSKEGDMSPAEYADHIEEWDSVRLQRLKSPTGWVNLAGLFWLDEGANSIGAAGTNDIVFPRGPEEIGVMMRNGDNVTCPLPPRENFLPFGVTAGEKAVARLAKSKKAEFTWGK